MYGAEGDLLRVVQMARMPEEKKATLKAMLEAELGAVLKQRPSLRLVKLSRRRQGQLDVPLSQALPPGDEILDFYHAAEHLSAAIGAAYGEGSIAARYPFDLKRHALRHEAKGVEVVIQHLQYFRSNRARMRYAKAASENLPIGSGFVEAACTTLVTQRLKLSGMRCCRFGQLNSLCVSESSRQR